MNAAHDLQIDRLDDAKQRFYDRLMANETIEIYTPGAGFQLFHHCNAIADCGGPSSDWAICEIHAQLQRHGKIEGREAEAARKELDNVLDRATEQYAPLMLAAEDERARRFGIWATR